MPLQRRLPKRGFRNAFREKVAIIHLGDLKRFEKDSVVEPDLLAASGLCKKGERIKLLADGELPHSMTIRVHKVSQAALKKVETASGKVEVIGT